MLANLHSFQPGRLGFRLLLCQLSLCIFVFAASPQRWHYFQDDRGVALAGYDPVAYFDGQAREGLAKYQVQHDGLTYYFADPQNQETFRQQAEAFLPQYGGWCAFAMGVAKQDQPWGPRRLAPDPQSFLIHEGKLYLFSKGPGFDARQHWQKGDRQTQLNRAQAFWNERQALALRLGALPEGMHPQAPMETAQFSFLMGTWHNKVQWMVDPETATYGPTIEGIWKARYSWDGFAVADDWQMVGVLGSGGPGFRSFDRRNREWVMTYIPTNSPRNQTWTMTGRFDERGELTGYLEGKDSADRAFQQTVHFYNIAEDRFSWRADRSYDGGKTWIKAFGRAENTRAQPKQPGKPG